MNSVATVQNHSFVLRLPCGGRTADQIRAVGARHEVRVAYRHVRSVIFINSPTVELFLLFHRQTVTNSEKKLPTNGVVAHPIELTSP